MQKNRRVRNLNWILSAGVLLLLFILIQSNGLQMASATSAKDASNHKKTETNFSTIDQAVQKEDQTLSHEQIITLTDQFMDMLVQETDNNNKVMDYHTKEELLNAFIKITTRDVASTYVDYYYHEASDGLYIIPTETPPWFNKENDYDMVQLDNNKVRVEQKNKSAMYGSYTVAYEFTLDNNWKITRITHAS